MKEATINKGFEIFEEGEIKVISQEMKHAHFQVKHKRGRLTDVYYR